MSSPRTWVFLSLTFCVGLGAGVWLQHRWPLGRVRDEWSSRPSPAARTVEDIARLPRARRLVLVCAGQSNAANYGDTRRAGGANIYAFADGKLFTGADPLPGGDGYGGSIWTRLGARLLLHGAHDAVVFAVVAQGSTSVTDWAPGGGCHARFRSTLQQLAAAGLSPDFILWQQGETEARSPDASGTAYAAALTALQDFARTAAPDAVFLPARATFGDHPAPNEQIRLAQSAAGARPGSSPGPDLDRLGVDFRSDGIHFNDRGLAAAADLWWEALRAPLLRRERGPSP